MVTYKNKTYPTRMFIVKMFGDEIGIFIGVQSLSDAMGDKKEVNGSLEQKIDDEIYFYLPDELFYLPAEEICAKHLDEPITFVFEEI